MAHRTLRCASSIPAYNGSTGGPATTVYDGAASARPGIIPRSCSRCHSFSRSPAESDSGASPTRLVRAAGVCFFDPPAARIKQTAHGLARRLPPRHQRYDQAGVSWCSANDGAKCRFKLLYLRQGRQGLLVRLVSALARRPTGSDGRSRASHRDVFIDYRRGAGYAACEIPYHRGRRPGMGRQGIHG
jgi:hypothetical protein